MKCPDCGKSFGAYHNLRKRCTRCAHIRNLKKTNDGYKPKKKQPKPDIWKAILGER